MGLREGTALLWRAPGEYQVGSDPDRCVVFSGLDAAEQAWLRDLGRRASVPPDGIPVHRRDPAVPEPPGARTILDRLDRVGLLAPEESAVRTSVRVDGIDAFTLAMVPLLAEAGVRRIEGRDPRPVDRSLVGTCGEEALGTSRSAVFAHAVGEAGGASRALADPDVVIVSGERVVDPAVTGMLVVEDRPHVVLTRHERSVWIGPAVVPGRSPCAQCLALTLADRDPHWPMVSRGMATWPLPSPPTAQVRAASVLAAREALAVVGRRRGGTPPPRTGASFGVLVVGADGEVGRRPLGVHPRCRCAAPPT